ncbi:SRPBCC domain-containing protein [Candidatus Palauibacter sp.]|uniref:SRPBCC domain-containing protein n=1 Tax=Candidatus Palauibacter sp. TaxID=3101350 RepID=UPI003AF22759
MKSHLALPAPIYRTLELDAPAVRVWAALADPERLGSWFPDRVEGLEPEEGASGWLVWDDHGRYAIAIEALEAGWRLVWRWARKPETPLAGGYNTTVEWTMAERDDGGTTLYLVERGFRSQEDRQDNVGGWEHELGELVDYLAAG